MKIVLCGICSTLLFFGVQVGYSQDVSLNEVVLLGRDYHIFVDNDEVLIYYNAELTFEEYLENLSVGTSQIFSKHYQFSIVNYSGDPSGDVFGDNMITVFEGSTEEIKASRLHHVLTSSYAVLGLAELGEPLVDNGAKPWVIGQGKAEFGYYFHRSVFPEVCSSFYFVNPESFNLPETPKYEWSRYSALFFISNTIEAEACFEKLFIDLIGLRGFAVDTEVGQQRISDVIDALNHIQNGHVFTEN